MTLNLAGRVLWAAVLVAVGAVAAVTVTALAVRRDLRVTR